MGGLSEGVFESELFGHVKGSFTDAKTDRIGRFELADQGTLFLDEIANITLVAAVQAASRAADRATSSASDRRKARHVDVRVLSATNADLHTEVATGRFREDLLFRLNTIEIHLPPLRERREDIPALAQHFLKRHAGRYRKTVHGFDAGGMQSLLEHSWPGNIRELDHAIERAVLLSQGELVRASDLGLRSSLPGVGTAHRGPDARRGREAGHPEGADAVRRQRQPGREGVRPEPQRALPASRNA